MGKGMGELISGLLCMTLGIVVITAPLVWSPGYVSDRKRPDKPEDER